MAFEHGRRVGEQRRDRVAALEAALSESRGEAARARVEIAVVAPQRAMNDRDMIRKNRRRALEEAQRRQRLEIGRIAVEVDIVRRQSHAAAPFSAPSYPSRD